jgi:sucrose phosphorylase
MRTTGENIFGGDAFAPASATRLHLTAPDYSRPPLEVEPEQQEILKEKLARLYDEERAEACYPELERILRAYYAHKTPEMIEEDRAFNPADRFTEEGIILITYGDLLLSPEAAPLQALSQFLTAMLRGAINTVHILPFFPYSSDRGFSVIDFEQVDPSLGSWEDIDEISMEFRLMFDGVFNHVSPESRWFQEFLAGNPEYQEFFIRFSAREAISEDHLQLVLRPRATDLLTPFETIDGVTYVWTTFGPDQVDLNFKNEKVLLRVIEILLSYARHGADIIRLDAITYLWWELGTRCAFLEQTHILVQLLRAVLNVVAPRVALVTETNIPHADNVSYFGDGSNETQMVYNFALPPLVLYSFLKGDCGLLSEWAEGLEHYSDTATYFNILDSHDGIPLLPVRDILSEQQVDWMIERILTRDGLISFRHSGDGTKLPYEMNITWYSALSDGDAADSIDINVKRFVASRSISFVLAGVPGIYLPSLFGSRNDVEAVLEKGSARSINRRTINVEALSRQCLDEDSVAHKIASNLSVLIEKRVATPAFHPNGKQRILRGNDAVFSIVRESPDGQQLVLALTNVTAREQRISFSEEDLGSSSEAWGGILSDQTVHAEHGILDITLMPYQVMWLTPHLSAGQGRDGVPGG